MPGIDSVLKALGDNPNYGVQSALYKYCSAWAMLTKVRIAIRKDKRRPNPDEQKQLAEARRLTEEALLNRAEWSALWRLRGEIEQEQGDVNSAVSSYQRAVQYSHSGQASIAQRLVQLLYAQKRYSEANEALKLAGDFDATDQGRRMIEDIVFMGGDVKSALAMAKSDAEGDPQNAMKQVWYGRLLERNSNSDEAEEAFRKAVESDPKLAFAWELYVRRLLLDQKRSEAIDAVHTAAKSLENEPGALARLYERVADNEHAEDLFKQNLSKDPKNRLALRQLVEFYFNSNQVPKALPYLDQMIEQSSKSTEPADVAQLALARRFKARVLASAGDYTHVVEATKLIEQNAKNGVLSPEDTRAIVALLASRGEPESRNLAVRMLEDLQKRQPLAPGEQAMLGRLYERAGKWLEARELMSTALTRNSDDLNILLPFAQLLIRHDEFDDAARWVDHMEELVAKAKVSVNPSVKQSIEILRARLLVKKGENEKAVELLEGFLPRPLPQNQLALLENVSRVLEELGLNDAAQKLLEQYVAQEPSGKLALAAFIARRGDVDKAFKMLEECRKSSPASAILTTALMALRQQPAAASIERLKMLEGWAEEGMQNEANPQRIRLVLAELYDLEGRSSDAVKIYREALADTKTTSYDRAVVSNNLAFLLAVTKENAGEALSLTNDAIRIVGPTADLLDTRALAYMAQGKLDQALADLRLAAADNPSGSKYFHLAQAEKQAQNIDAARDALAKAQQAGLQVGQFSPAERKLYTQLTAELK